MVSLIDSWEVGHRISAAAFPPDTTRVAVASRKAPWIYDTHTGRKLIGPLEGHGDTVWALVFSPDGRTLASGSEDATVRLWDTETGNAIVGPLIGHNLAVMCVAFSLDGHFVVSGSNDYTVRIWDARTGEAARGPIRPALQARSLALIPGGRLAVGGSSEWEVFTVYEMDKCAALFECAGHDGVVRSISCSPDGRLLASGSSNTIHFWDPASGTPIGEPLKGHSNSVTSLSFSPDGRYIASGSRDDSIRLWDAETRKMHGEPLLSHRDSVLNAAFTSDGSCLVSADWEGAVKVWDVRSLCIPTEILGTPAGMTTQVFNDEVTSTTSPKQAVSQIDVQDFVDATNQLKITAATGAEITSATTPEEIVLRLSIRGCTDMAEQLDLATCGERPISSGGFGDIYQGRLKDGTQVAIKTIRLYVGSGEQDKKILKVSQHVTALLARIFKATQRAAHEVYAWSKCKHPNVQPLLGLVMFRGHIGMIAAWESNGSLPQYLERRADADRCNLSNQIAEGLSYLHASGVVHGDLKGANVLISQHGVAQLADFGNAKLKEYTLKFTETSTKEALSSRWAAPELFEGKPCSYATDVYALGMTILEVITGDVPWKDKSERAVMFAITIKRVCPDRPQTYIPASSAHGDMLWALLKSCWEFEPEERPSVANVARAPVDERNYPEWTEA
ncbi:hypothetical protein FRC12_008216 [Ceratobasidium sp. 428]|nr:hypothetical protein FRC12_008216 [Ceratobasidium sp. 428]